MPWLIGKDNDGQPTAINLDGVRRITVCDAHDEPWFVIERGDDEAVQSMDCEGAVIVDDLAVIVQFLRMVNKQKGQA